MTRLLRPGFSAGLAVAVLLLGGCAGAGPTEAAAAITMPTAAATAATFAEADGEVAASGGVPDAGLSGTPKRRVYLREGNRVCAEGSAELAGIGDDIGEDDEQALLAAITDQVVPNIRGQIADLRALGFPAGDARRLNGILGDTDDVLDAWAADPAMAFTDTRMEAVSDRLNDYGLTSCGES